VEYRPILRLNNTRRATRGDADGAWPDGGFFRDLATLASAAPLDHYFNNLHLLINKYAAIPILVAAVKDKGSPDGFKARYQRSLTERDLIPTFDRQMVKEALRAGTATPFGLPRLPTGGFLKSASSTSGSVIVAPMHVENEIVGYLAARNPVDGSFGESELNWLAAAADVAALVVHAKLSDDDAKARTREVRLMLETARALSTERDVLKLYSRFQGLVGGVMDAETFWIAIGSWERMHMRIPYCISRHQLVEIAEPLPLNGSLSGQVFREGIPIIIRSPKELAAFPSVEQGCRDGVKSALVVPMRIGARTIGAISVQSSQFNAYSEGDCDLMAAIAEQAAIAVENSEAIECAEQRAKELSLLSDVSRALTAQRSLTSLCRTVCDHVRGAMNAPVFFVALAEPDGHSYAMQYCVEDGALRSRGKRQPLENTLIERVLRSGQPLVLHSVAEIDSQPHGLLPDGDASRRMQTVAMAPLRLGTSCLGVMCAQSRLPNAYQESHVRLIVAIADHLALAVQNAQLFSDARSRAERDPLTNLFNHRYLKTRLDDEIGNAAVTGRQVSVLMTDLDNFKLVNDTYGHPVGDEALRLMTSVLLSSCRSTDIVGRYGGDEFMVILPDADRATVIGIADRISQDLAAQRLHCGGVQIPIRTSAGFAVFPDDGTSPSDIVAKADAALYESKRQGQPVGRLQKIGSRSMRLVGDFSAVSELLAALLARDPSTRDHLEHVNRLAYDFAEALDLNDDDRNALLLASVLHDVGKIAIPDSVLRKPGKLSKLEYELVQRHPLIGASLIEHIPGYGHAAEVVLHHHESFDGSGYPGRFAGEDIPLLARVVTLIDAYSAMIIDRPYHKGLTSANAIAELRRCAGTQFDPQLVERFADLVKALPLT
jgi:diguanylate cyclase (GGDEF)-like protein